MKWVQDMKTVLVSCLIKAELWMGTANNCNLSVEHKL